MSLIIPDLWSPEGDRMILKFLRCCTWGCTDTRNLHANIHHDMIKCSQVYGGRLECNIHFFSQKSESMRNGNTILSLDKCQYWLDQSFEPWFSKNVADDHYSGGISSSLRVFSHSLYMSWLQSYAFPMSDTRKRLLLRFSFPSCFS